MSPKSALLLTLLFLIILSLSISGKLNIPSSAPSQTFRAKATQAPKPILLPLDSPISAIKEFLSPSPSPKAEEKVSASESFESVEELQQSKNISLDLTVGGIPFGGKVLNNTYCDPYSPPCYCGGAEELIDVGPPRRGTFAINNETTIYEFYDWSAGNWVLGLAHFYNDICFLQVINPFTFGCVYCQYIGNGPAINIMGTSQ